MCSPKEERRKILIKYKLKNVLYFIDLIKNNIKIVGVYYRVL